MNIFFSAFGQSDGFGKMIFMALFALSAISWIILIYKVWMIRSVGKVCRAFQATVDQHRERLLELDLDALPQPTRKEVPHPFGRILGATSSKTIEVLKKNLYFMKAKNEEGEVYLTEPDLMLIETHGALTIAEQKKELEKNLFVLATSVTLAPFLGLLGTVWGILVTFTHLQSGASVSSSQLILGGLSTALATTVLGLVIAIPALISYNYLKHRLKVLSTEMDSFLTSLLSTLEMQYRKV